MVRGVRVDSDDYIEISFSGEEAYSECVDKVLRSLSCEWDTDDGCDMAQICRVNGTSH